MPLHGLGVAPGQDETGADAARRADGTEDIGRLGALIAGRTGPGSPLGPAACDLVLLADPGLVLKPKLYLGAGRQPGPDRRLRGGEAFLKSSLTNSFCARCRGRAEILTKPSAFSSRLTVLSSKETRNSSQIHCTRSFKRQRTTPWIAGISSLSTILQSAQGRPSFSIGDAPGSLRSIRP